LHATEQHDHTVGRLLSLLLSRRIAYFGLEIAARHELALSFVVGRVLALPPAQWPTAGTALVVVSLGFLGGHQVPVAAQAEWGRGHFRSQHQRSLLQDLLSDLNVPGGLQMPAQEFVGGYFEALALRAVTFLPVLLLVLPTAVHHVPAGGAQLRCLGLAQGAGCQRTRSHRKQSPPAVKRYSIDLQVISVFA